MKMVRIDRYVRQYVSKLLVDAELNKVKMANQRQLKGDKLLKVRLNMHFIMSLSLLYPASECEVSLL